MVLVMVRDGWSLGAAAGGSGTAWYRAVLLGVACLHVLGVSDEGFLVRCFCLWGFWTWCIGRGGSGLGVSHFRCF